MLKSASLLVLGLLLFGCSTQQTNRTIATSIQRFDYGENIFRVLPSDTMRIWVTLVRDNVKSDSCNRNYFASAPKIEQRYATHRIVPAIQPHPIRRRCSAATVSADGRTIPGTCPQLGQRTEVLPGIQETIIFGYKLDIGGIFTTELGCTGPRAGEVTYQTVVSAPIELEVTSSMGLTIGVPEGIDRIEVTTIPPKVVKPQSGTHVIDLSK